MPYTIWSRGQLVGETKLEHDRVDPRQRSGDFLPTAFGETLIPAADLDDDLPPDVHVTTSQLEELELRGPDGTLITAEWIEIHDTANTRSLVCPQPPPDSSVGARPANDSADVPDDFDLDDWDAPNDDLEFLEDAELDFAEFDHGLEAPAPGEFPRFQIDVRLVDEHAIP